MSITVFPLSSSALLVRNSCGVKSIFAPSGSQASPKTAANDMDALCSLGRSATSDASSILSIRETFSTGR